MIITLGSDGDKYCFCLRKGWDNEAYVEVHKRTSDGFSAFNEQSLVTKIPLDVILKYSEY